VIKIARGGGRLEMEEASEGRKRFIMGDSKRSEESRRVLHPLVVKWTIGKKLRGTDRYLRQKKGRNHILVCLRCIVMYFNKFGFE
jgi:hypothetical protein